MSLLDDASLIITPNSYKESKLYSIKPTDGSGDLSVVRATTATRVNSDGLIELVPYNLLNYSEQFDNAIWSNIALQSVISNSITSPDGTLTAEKVIPNTTSTNHYLLQNTTIIVGQTYTFSFFAKKGEYDFTSTFISAISANVYWDLQNGIASSGASIEDYGNGWYRCIVSGVATSTSASVRIYIQNSSSSIFAGDGTSGIYIWGAQLVQGSEAKEYLRTETRLNIPRLDYSNGCPSILVEPQRTNLISDSNLANNISGFTKITGQSSPDGLNNASLLTEVALNNQKFVNSANATILGNTTYAYSVFLKYNGIQNIIINATDAISGFTRTFDILNGVIVGTSTDAFIIPYSDGWYRCVVIRTTGASAVIGFVQINLGTYLGDGMKGFYWFGAQVEAGSNATSYIPTVASSVTRNADVISKMGISDLIGQSEGTIFVDFNKAEIANSSGILELGELNNEIVIWQNTATQLRFFVRVSGSVFGSRTYNISDERLKIALTYQSNSYSVFLNGIKILDNIPITSLSTSYSGIILGNRFTNQPLSALNSSINSVILWKTQLTDEQCISLTTI